MDALHIKEKIAKFIVVNRLLADMTQTNIAKKSVRTFQQIQKYENCTNKICHLIFVKLEAKNMTFTFGIY